MKGLRKMKKKKKKKGRVQKKGKRRNRTRRNRGEGVKKMLKEIAKSRRKIWRNSTKRQGKKE